MGRMFGERLRCQLDARGPLCVGIDPSPELLRAWGLEDSAAGLERFSRTVVEAVGDLAAVVKPQSAFFERLGSKGIAVLEAVVRDARHAGALVLLDAKRGDIDSTSQAYADAYLDPRSPLAVDAVTASPYLGFGSLAPMIETAVANGAGVFVLGRTSNPEGAEVQQAVTLAGSAVATMMLDKIGELNAGAGELGSIGVVWGATVADQEKALAGFNGPILAPGLGEQGATVADIARNLADVRSSVIPSASRAILRTGPDPQALRDITSRLLADCARLLRD